MGAHPLVAELGLPLRYFSFLREEFSFISFSIVQLKPMTRDFSGAEVRERAASLPARCCRVYIF